MVSNCISTQSSRTQTKSANMRAAGHKRGTTKRGTKNYISTRSTFKAVSSPKFCYQNREVTGGSICRMGPCPSCGQKGLELYMAAHSCDAVHLPGCQIPLLCCYCVDKGNNATGGRDHGEKQTAE
uniref:Uncharacterized protein n=1 Tax=Arundo donax TaxID=35708 RepID=A0A0A9HFZ3_ARUDO